MRTSVTSSLASMLVLGLLAACAVQGPPESKGAYPVVDMHADLGTIDGSAVLAAPADWTPKPSVITPVFPVSAGKLFDAMQVILAAEPRTWLVSAHPEQQQAAFLVRSRAMNDPDSVIVQAVPASDTTSRAVIFSRTRFDVIPDNGSNRKRVLGMISALTDRFGTVASPAAKP